MPRVKRKGKTSSFIFMYTYLYFDIYYYAHLLSLLLNGPFSLVGVRLLNAETRSVVLGAALLHRLAQSMLCGLRRCTFFCGYISGAVVMALTKAMQKKNQTCLRGKPISTKTRAVSQHDFTTTN